MNSSKSLRTRAVMALFLMVGFYGFSLAIAGGLLWVPYASYTYLERVDGRIALFCIIGAATILWALVPRIDKFEAPGPRLTPTTAPYLFSIIEEIAKATKQPRPEEVYLLGEVNAFVTQRGGFMGFGSRRVMGVGLPLLKALSPAELRSVIAHEFGHFVSGDVALGPWIYKTRAAIFRALEGLSGNILQGLFNWYGRMFMRMTMQVSREQEFVADATAARVAGVAPAVSALKRVEFIAPAYGSYINNEVMPVLSAGFLPPMVEGFDRYLADPDMAKVFHDYASQALGTEVGEYDSHPPTLERIAALQRIKQPPKENPKDATAVMLKEPERHIRALMEHMYGREQHREAEADQVGRGRRQGLRQHVGEDGPGTHQVARHADRRSDSRRQEVVREERRRARDAAQPARHRRRSADRIHEARPALRRRRGPAEGWLEDRNRPRPSAHRPQRRRTLRAAPGATPARRRHDEGGGLGRQMQRARHHRHPPRG